MADLQRTIFGDRNIEQAITSLKKGAYLLKYGRRGKPKFCPFRLSSDESLLIWYAGKDEKQLKLNAVSKIIPGQRTAIFQRYPRPEKEYQSFSLIYNDRSLDLICKDKDEAETWFVGLKELISRGNDHKWRCESRSESAGSYSPQHQAQRNSPVIAPFDLVDSEEFSFDSTSENRLGRAFSEIISYTAAGKSPSQAESNANSCASPGSGDNSNNRNSIAEPIRVSLSSAVSSSSHSSYQEDFDAIGDVFIFGEGIGDGILGGGLHRLGTSSGSGMDAFLPKALESKVVLDVQSISCGYKHAALVTKQGEIYSWGEELGGRLGHGVEVDVSHPKLIDSLNGINIELVACGEYHTCAVTFSGDLYTWGDGIHNSGLLGHGNEVSHWIPKRVSGNMEGVHVSYVSCGPWHTAIVTSSGQLFTFGDGSFGALGLGDLSSTNTPREVETLKGMRTTRVSCGIWHTAAVVEVATESMESSKHLPVGKLFTWGDGDKGRLGHGDSKPRLVPQCVISLDDQNICQVACGHSLTVALTASGHVYTMGSTTCGQLGSPAADGKFPTQVEGKIAGSFIEDIACGSYHVGVLTSKAEVYTWGKGSNGQLGHGDNGHRDTPTLVKFFENKQARSVVCGSNFTAVICPHKWASSADQSVCSGCHNPFGFRRKRHNCYNCGLVFCSACSSRKSTKASLAPNPNKPYRVCDDCYSKLKKTTESVSLTKTSTSKNLPDSWAGKLQGKLLRISSFGSNVQAESRHSKIPEPNHSHVFPALNGKLQLGGFSPLKAPNPLAGALEKPLSVSVPASGLNSEVSSPVSEKLSPRWSSEDVHDDSKHRNSILSQEVISLRLQVEDLTLKSKHLEDELERTSKQLKEVTAVAAEEAEKCKSAKEVIKSLTAQLKEMVQRVPEGGIASSSANFSAEITSNVLNQSSNETQIANSITPETESNSHAENRILLSIPEAQRGKSEWMVQDEPGVYISLSSLPSGGNELKRVRFSRKHFTEQEAEKWWAENGTKVLERHNVVAT
ncbi:hypothetical protein K1719_017114 [Acacia pycnantha]|nr:hypothetical protein K1719_017114 [Acacia pycnantha]